MGKNKKRNRWISSLIATFVGAIITTFVGLFTPFGNLIIENYLPKPELSFFSMYEKGNLNIETINRLLILENTGGKIAENTEITMHYGEYIPVDKFEVLCRTDNEIIKETKRYMFVPDSIDFDVKKEVVRKVKIEKIHPGQVVIIKYLENHQWDDNIYEWFIYNDNNRGVSVMNDSIAINKTFKSCANQFPNMDFNKWAIGNYSMKDVFE